MKLASVIKDKADKISKEKKEKIENAIEKPQTFQ